MKILLESRAFYPSAGGLEMISHELAVAWQRRRHSVCIVTITPLENHPELNDVRVVRQQSFLDLWKLLRWSDVFLQNGISLRSLGLALFARKPIIFCHANILERQPGHLGVRNQLKRWATYLGHNIVSSSPVAERVMGSKSLIPNTFRPIFRHIRNRSDNRRSGLLFVGRLVSGKGVDVALDALADLHRSGHPLNLTICGHGPERAALELQAKALQLQDHVHFNGWTEPSALVEYYLNAEVALIPSHHEAFGIVALEAIAAGCPVVAANTGGLPEAVGPCGLLFEPGNAKSLAAKVQEIRVPTVRARMRSHMADHMAKHDIDQIADRYLKILEAAVE